MEESSSRRTEVEEEEWRAKGLHHLLLLRVSCPSHSKLRPLACAPPALIVPGSSVTKVTRVASTTTNRATTKTTSGATAATPWTAPLKATMTVTSDTAAVTRGDRDRGGACRQDQEGREEVGEEVEVEEGGGTETETETEASIIIITSTISSITTPTTTPIMHHSSQDLTPITTACHAPGPRPLLLTCC